MCFFGSKPKAPEAPQMTMPPAPAPTPTITPSESSPMQAGESRRKRLEQMRYGLASTIKGGQPKGMFGTGSQLTGATTGATTLG